MRLVEEESLRQYMAGLPTTLPKLIKNEEASKKRAKSKKAKAVAKTVEAGK